MTEGKWRASLSPISPLHWLFFHTPAAERKLRLFSVACCRRIGDLIQGASLFHLLHLAESFAEGQTDEVTLRSAHREEWRKYTQQSADAELSEVPATVAACLYASRDAEGDRTRQRSGNERLTPDCIRVVWQVLEARAPARQRGAPLNRRKELGAQMRLLHDIFGPLPVCDIAVEPSWLTSDVLALARGIYEEKAFDRMPILADALQDAGCDNNDILSHCRAENWEHVRGCWVIDLLLGRPWREPS